MGEWNTDTDVDCITRGIRICNQASVDVGIDNFKVHEGYKINNRNGYNDIGLIRLARKVSYTSKLRLVKFLGTCI